jgi:hypothetical protein
VTGITPFYISEPLYDDATGPRVRGRACSNRTLPILSACSTWNSAKTYACAEVNIT